MFQRRGGCPVAYTTDPAWLLSAGRYLPNTLLALASIFFLSAALSLP